MLEGCAPYPGEFAERYRREGLWRAEAIPAAVATAARAWPDAIAVVDERRALSFSQLLAEAARTAALLGRNGLSRGDRIVIQLPNCTEFASLFLACLEVGAIPVMALPAFRRAELEYLASFSAAKAIAIAPEYRGFDYAALASELRASIASLQLIFVTDAAPGCIDLHAAPAAEAPLGSAAGDPYDVALFLLSGGTTGLPKLIPRTHADYLYNAREAARACGLDARARILLALPAEHNFPLACPGLLGALLTGATAVFSQSMRAQNVAAIIARERITHLPCVPAIAMALAELALPERAQLEPLRVITVGGARLQEHTARALRRMLPALKIQQVFGMAEGLLCYTRLDDPDEITFTTQGRALSPADEIRVVTADGIDAPAGEVGELWCRGPYTIRGYYRAPERNREAFTTDGFYRTGDLVRMTPPGNLIVAGRIKDLINRGGEKISAEEIEAHLVAHPAVRSAAVVAMPDAALGERVCAYVTLRPNSTLALAQLREFLLVRGVARFKWPERLEIVAEMPVTNVGKIRKATLRNDIERKLDVEREAAAPTAAPARAGRTGRTS
jgi:2,3-dihydroxybenzoate-AMP ligase